MYETAFDTDWDEDEIDVDEATDRMFAFGVASVLDCESEGERDRLRAQADRAYAWSMLDLSYEEGQQKARKVRRAPDSDADDPGEV